MATKKEIFDSAIELCTAHEASEALIAGLTLLLEPKKGGAHFDIEEISVKDESGELTHIFDSVIKLWVPIFDEEGEPNFYDKPDTELGWSRFTRVSEKLRKDAEKAFKASKDGVFSDLMAGDITQEEAQEIMNDATEARKVLEAPEGFGSIEKP